MTWQDSAVDDRAELIAKLTLLGEVSATQTALFQQAAAASYGLGITEMKALSIVLREGPQTAGALVTQLGVTSGAVTGVIDRLVKAGFARREADAGDRRKVMVVPEYAALASGPNVYEPIGDAFAKLHETYSTDDLSLIADYLERSIEITRNQTAALFDS